MNIAIDDTSPLISYYSKDGNGSSSNWITASAQDPFFLGTYHESTTEGDYVTFDFNASAIYIYGTSGGGYTPFTATFDTNNPGIVPKPPLGETDLVLLVYVEGLANGTQHKCVLTNSNEGGALLDYIVLTLPQ